MRSASSAARNVMISGNGGTLRVPVELVNITEGLSRAADGPIPSQRT